MQKSFDYIIVGAGSAGCVLAERLSRSGQHTVCVIEAGPSDRHPLIHIPIGVAGLIGNRKLNWCFETEPERHLGNRRLFWPRGKVLGGSSSINAMVYMRGHAADYDEWAALTQDPSWRYEVLLPIFREHENNQRGSDQFHGAGGPLHVSDLRGHNPLSDVYVQAGVQAGIPLNPDFNGARQEGVGLHQVTQRKGQRWSSARAFLPAPGSRANLTVMTGVAVTRVLLQDKRAVGVELCELSSGQRSRLQSAKEVILCGGSVNSPQLLMLSGIGPAEQLRPHAIEQLHQLDGVGKNLQDHLDYTVMIRDASRSSIGLAFSFIGRAIAGLIDYLFHRRGFLASNVAEGGGFARLTPQSERPEVQFHFLPTLLKDHGRQLVAGYGCTLHVCQLRPRSRGHVGLKSADPLADPLIVANYLDHPADVEELLAGVRLVRKILAAPAFKAIHGGEVAPGADVQSDEQLLADIRQRAETIYHPVGTCKMGIDALAVVDPQLRVIGISGLRVADASVMPTLIGGNTNAPTMVIAEMAARLILGERPAAPPQHTADRPAPRTREAMVA
ncbi:GMC family oxidoreductase [Hydrocarboniphaga sp.]|uniref:GMC family oxidoreductase n=1 Tax=Hydrocarboniphaga sp. TaxID=2033016 RepID=UPI003D09BBA9